MIDRIFASKNYAASKELLDVAVMRHEAIASNLANVETPGYKRVDIDPSFAAAFAAKMKAGGGAGAVKADVVVDTQTTSQRMDGNNVEIDRELLAMGKNGAEFETLAEFVSGSLKQLRLAITGRPS